MKKDVPDIIRINVPYDRESFENVLLWRFHHIIKEGYTFAIHDFNLYCALLLRQESLNNLPVFFKNYITQSGKIRPEVRFQKIAVAIEKREKISKRDTEFYDKMILEDSIERMKIVRKEIKRTGLNPLKVNKNNSIYYRELISLVKEFSDLTLMDWFIPIVLKFEKLVHIYVKHVEETKFSDGQFKKRSFFDYKHSEILTLLKKLLKKEEQEIKEHFLDNSIGFDTNDPDIIKDYHRGFRNYPPIILGQDYFRLSINKYGFIETFYQIK